MFWLLLAIYVIGWFGASYWLDHAMGAPEYGDITDMALCGFIGLFWPTLLLALPFVLMGAAPVVLMRYVTRKR